MRFISKLIAAAGLVLAASMPGVAAETYPTRTITLVVPFAAGGPSDAIGRLVAKSMSVTLGQQVIIENVAGAGGTLAAGRVAKANPDGYTLLIQHVALPASAALYGKLAYDTRTAFDMVGLVNYGPMVLMTKKAYPVNNIAELIAKLKMDGPKTTFAHAGVGSNSYLCGLLMQKELGVKFTEVGYRGTGPAMIDLMGGQVDVLCDQSTTSVPQINAGTVKGMAVTSKDRLDVLKNLPTLQEAGMKDFEFTIWHGIYAPKGVRPEILKKLNAALQKAVADPEIQAQFAQAGTASFPPEERTIEAHRKRFEKELATWKSIIKAPVIN